MSEADLVSLLCEPAGCESRRDDEEHVEYFEEEQRRVAPRGPLRRLAEFADDI
ncbi:MAG: hypothetical protein AB8I08_18340 [Sandaracinaceae bacterium]